MTIHSYGSSRPIATALGGGTVVFSQLFNIPITSTTFSSTISKTAAPGTYTVYAPRTDSGGNVTISITDANGDIKGSFAPSSFNLQNNVDLEAGLASVTLDYVYPSWNTRSPGFATNNVLAAAYGRGTWVVGGDAGLLSTSTDGITWTTRTSTFGTSITEIVYGGGLFVAGGVSGQLRYSTDGITWATSTSPFGASTVSGLTYGENKYVATAGTAIATSTDAVTWTTQTSPFIANGGAISCVAYGNTYFMAGCLGAQGGPAVTMLCYSTDGITWTSTQRGLAFPDPDGDGDYGVKGLAYLSNSTAAPAGIWVAVGIEGKLATATATTFSPLVTWINRTSGFGTTNINAVAYGDRSLVIVGNAGKLSVSTDGSTWTVKASNFGTTNINAVAYGNELFMAVGGPNGVRTQQSSYDNYVQIASI